MRLRLIAVLAVGFLAVRASADEAVVLKTQEQKLSYSVGVQVARNVGQQGVVLDVDMLVRGLRDALSGGKLLMTEDDIRTAMSSLRRDAREKQAQAARMYAESNAKAGVAFLAENKKKAGVVELPSGLQYKIITAGTGRKPIDTDTVECNYRGTHIDGSEFDSSYSRGEPATFAVSGVIRGWQEALKLMPVGSKWQLFVPAQLAYGERGAGSSIGPNETLVFEVELLAIK